ncbi:MAG: sensor histidine kinase [Bauldia sp.]
MALAADTATAAIGAGRGRRGLFRKYVLLFIGVVSGALFVSGVLEIWFVYREQTASLERLQQSEADAASYKIDQFLSAIEGQMGWSVQFPWLADDAALFEQRRSDAQRLLRQVPAITEIAFIDPAGREQLRVSRLAMDVIGGGADRSNDPAFTATSATETYFGPVYYRRESEPYLTMAVAGARVANGVAVAEVNLKFILDLVSTIEVGSAGVAYVVDGRGRLIAHPDISLVLRNTDLATLPQVRDALAGAVAVTAHDQSGARVISAHAAIPRLGWFVFVELPIGEALGPIYLSIARTFGLLLLGLALAGVAGLLLVRRLMVPIRALETGAATIGDGDLGHRIDVRTGDELEGVAHQFNDMADRLQASLAGLEQRVAERTAQLADKSRQLELASQHKSQFLANMSHELRTPLNAVLGYTELMLDDIYGAMPDRAREVLARVQVNGRHLLQMINDVLDLSKIEAGQLELAHERYDLGTIVASVVSSTDSLAQSKGLTVTAAIEPGLPPGIGDPRRVTQVVLNLLGNAIKFTDAGFVAVSLRPLGGDLELTVRDSGPGIDPADHAKIFNEFQQVDSSSTRSKSGTGLGLSISKRIVDLHGGSIALASRIGEGATFRVLLPAAAGETP